MLWLSSRAPRRAGSPSSSSSLAVSGRPASASSIAATTPAASHLTPSFRRSPSEFSPHAYLRSPFSAPSFAFHAPIRRLLGCLVLRARSAAAPPPPSAPPTASDACKSPESLCILRATAGTSYHTRRATLIVMDTAVPRARARVGTALDTSRISLFFRSSRSAKTVLRVTADSSNVAALLPSRLHGSPRINTTQAIFTRASASVLRLRFTWAT